jgi:hypothetical protein
MLLVFPKLVFNEKYILVCKSLWVYDPADTATFKIANVEVDVKFTAYQQKRNWYYTPEKGVGSIENEVCLEVSYYGVNANWKAPDFEKTRLLQSNFIRDLEEELGMEL